MTMMASKLLILRATIAQDSATLAHFTVTPSVTTWVARRQQDDPEALQAWARAPVLAGSAAEGNASRATLRRLTWHPNCPLLSTLSATLVQQRERPWTVSIRELTSDCR
ncbi:MAG: hypothetical protein ACREOC_16300 [Gemmatimonadales bacterium]